MKIVLIISLMLASFSSLALSCNNFKQQITFEDDIKGIILIVHGLNLNPEKMESLGNFYKAKKIAPIYVRLTGHTENTSWDQVTKQRWIKDFYSPLCQAHVNSKQLNIPMYGLGFSLGALVIQHAIEKFNAPFESVSYIAPAFKTRWYTMFITALFKMGLTFEIPSGNFVEYRAKDSTGLLAYKGMWEITQELKFNDNIKKVITMDKRDELIDYFSTRDLCKTWSNCQMEELISSPSKNEKKIYHLAIDSATLGQKAWNKLTLILSQQL
ncbi:hypothetical protein BIY24_07510 [Halobacteriovorax marinus]|uniref:serine aminopeptidase domain-containing protein n=1 Tax=Halobacteriovorax marinus TaxID=97084 RepID=UPI000BC3525E|nr:alpha/beta hydrolase [Halobacteriovorax marinus]ATH07799.1 hypothetical protein BIY24_07510 [Halobacteriovorax marinus]